MSSSAYVAHQSWEYRDITKPLPKALLAGHAEPAAPVLPAGITEDQVKQRISVCLQAAEQRWRSQSEAEEAGRNARFLAALDAFAAERTAYFQRVEAEVVHLALAITRKIIQRETELDPTLLAALVRIALDRMGAAPAVRLRVPPQTLPWWQEYGGFEGSRYLVEVVPDNALQPGDCLVETDLGVANFAFEAQIKEVEQGLFDLIARRPGSR